MAEMWNGPVDRIDKWRISIPKEYKRTMKVPGLIYIDESMMEKAREDNALQQVVNVAQLPGILGASIAMPDIHWGYGFPIGGVAAMDADEGVVSPGGVGYDINCGVRLLRTNLTFEEINGKMDTLADKLFQNIPSGVGSTGRIKLSAQDEKAVLEKGAAWAVEHGYGWEADLDVTEENGRMDRADAKAVSARAMERGKQQLGTLGSGNHFLEIQEVTGIFDAEKAETFGLQKGQIVIMIHTGSRGFGYQVCDDQLEEMIRAMSKFKIRVPDKQLVCAPIGKPEGEMYLAAMAAAANYAWANRQIIMHGVRQTFEQVFEKSAQDLDMHLVYDVAHNIAKFETHVFEGKERKVLVHRKGATRAFGPKHSEVPLRYQSAGQPVLIPGDMGTASYVLAGTQKAMDETFGSTCHGAGRMMSRHAAIRATEGREIAKELEDKGITVRSSGKLTLKEEAPEAYKDIHHVVEVVHQAGISTKVAKMKPLVVVKG